MGFETTALVALLVLAAAVVVLAVMLLRRPAAGAPAAPDPNLALLQQQVSRLAEQIASLGAQVPKDVGASLAQAIGQVQGALALNAQALQKASADTGKLISDISHRLGELGRASQQVLELQQDIRGLQQIFQAPKIRGGLGELSLEAMLRQFFPTEHFALQHPFSNGETVDAVVRLREGLVPIDSKFPLANFRAVIDAAGEEERRRARRQFARDVRKHIDDIAEKYIRPAQGTLDFALMYIPAENVYYETILRDEGQGDDDLSAYAMRKRVMPVSPNSFFAYLQAIAIGLRGLKVEEHARAILMQLQQLQGDFTLFQDTFAVGQKHLKNAHEKFSEAGGQASRLQLQVDQLARLDEGAEPPRATPIATRGLQQ